MIEAELDKLTPEELRRLALRSWRVVEKEGTIAHECDEDDPCLLASLDEAIAAAEAERGKGQTADEVRARSRQWISK
jgi:hypothetical protein